MAIFTVNGQENHRCALGIGRKDHIDGEVLPLVPVDALHHDLYFQSSRFSAADIARTVRAREENRQINNAVESRTHMSSISPVCGPKERNTSV